MLWLLWLPGVRPAHAAPAFLEPEQAFPLSAQPVDGGKVKLHWTVAPGYYLYRDRLSVTASPGNSPLKANWPAGDAKADPNFGNVEVYHRDIDVEVDPEGAAALQVAWQGCAEAGLCYPPQHRTVALAGISQAVDASTPAPPVLQAAAAGDAGISRMWAQRSLWWSLPLALVLGIAMAFTPCVLPMVPILSGVVVGQQATTRRAFALSVAFVLPMALVYAGLGLVAAWAGSGLQATLQNPWTVAAFSLIFVALAFSMFGFYELQLPAAVADRLAGVTPRGGSLAGAGALGVLSALLVGPCMTAPLAGTLLYIVQSGNLVEGSLLLLALGLGMGVPLIVISTLGAHWLPRPGAWMVRVKAGFGFVMLATAAWMAQRVLPPSLGLLLWGAVMASVALTAWHTADPREGRAASTVLLRSTAVVVGLWSAAMVIGAGAGATDPLRPLAQWRSGALAPAASSRFEVIRDAAVLQERLGSARAHGQPVLLDFSADWCTSCKTLDREVFGDPQVTRALGGMLLLRADLTASDPSQQALMRRFQVMGPPTVMLFDSQGAERRADRLVGEFAPADLLKRLGEAGSAS